MNNQQKYFHKIYCKFVAATDGKKKDIAEDIEYMSRTYDVKFYKYMSWRSNNVVIDGYDFGRFDIRFIPSSPITFLIHHKYHKHPHAYPNWVQKVDFGKKIYTPICVGSPASYSFYRGNLLNSYRMFNDVVKNVDKYHACSMSQCEDCDREDEIVEFCHNFYRKNIKKCENCGGLMVDDECLALYCEDFSN